MRTNDLDLAGLASRVAEVAAQELLPRFQHVTAQRKADGSLLTAADLAVQGRLAALLRQDYPDYALLGEEMAAADQQQLLGASDSGLWCLDPLDGTGNFAGGIPVFAVSLALLRHGRIEAGVVHDPVRGESFWARRGGGAWLNGAPLRVPEAPRHLADTTALVDFKRLPAALATAVATRPPFVSAIEGVSGREATGGRRD